MADRTSGGESGSLARNEVLLVGRVAALPEERELPSGDRLVSLRLVVDRPAPRRPPTGRVVTVDTLDCAAWTAGSRRTARSLQPGDVVEVQGALRRRFWRSGAAAASRTEVEVSALRRLVRADTGPSSAARRARPRGDGEAVRAAGPPGGPQAARPVAQRSKADPPQVQRSGAGRSRAAGGGGRSVPSADGQDA